ncbi:hypothetical protein SAMN05660235_02902 [Sporolituus thermophilus DSM 23256]|uniref:Uncharacterized protein n=1 Tax=Sporolituus thermophilus DSM 23256 TaxID=1123285 RepID=A0A1G7PBW5_9FIRM|nr:hypothetical protein SAMN05660235_02902 [Sporolituus thermophilus DSM 23256]
MNEGLKGLMIRGTVTGRTRRLVGKDKTNTVVTYRINDGSSDYFVDEWNPSEYYTVGEIVCLPVYVKIYSHNSINRLNYVVKTSTANMIGEVF